MASPAQRKQAEQFLVSAISAMGELNDQAVIGRTVNSFAPVLMNDYYQLTNADIEELVRVLETRFVTTMDQGVVLTDESQHDDMWPERRHIPPPYWEDYQELLRQQGWAPRVIQSLDTVTSRVLGLLEDPKRPGDWERRGLIIGHVQSGKTANYIGLIAKAADAGYKFIIVIAGIHNELRTQTQSRIDQGFIGTDSGTKQRIGVGLIRPNRDFPATVTTTASDFNSTTARNFVLQLGAIKNTLILVIKKNVSTLTHLHTWLRDLNTQKGFEEITDIPMLLIDDEADNASINTKSSDSDPTRINQEIRRILRLFRKKCYVGYTATPFANIFINPDARHDQVGDDLFPRHFIYSLDAPSNYFGYGRVFLDDDGKRQFIRAIADADNWLPASHKKDSPVDDLPSSLRDALNLFILVRAVRNARGQAHQHCSMLVNVSPFVGVQREVADVITAYLNRLNRAVKYNAQMPHEQALQEPAVAELFRLFEAEYASSDTVWSNVVGELSAAAEAVKVVVVNNRSQERLMYAEYTRAGEPATVIAVGGYSLSRGLTLEGLTISYINRNTKMYDTLLQMGRWFGYRPGYEDLCRVWMSETSYEWYAHIAEATDELRAQVQRMHRERRTPDDFGLYVRAHPDALTVTAVNKMHHTALRSFSVSYDGKLVETYILPDNETKTAQNRELFRKAFDDLTREQQPHTDKSRSSVLYGLSADRVHDFIREFQFHQDLNDIRDALPRYIEKIADEYPLWDVGFVSITEGEPVPGFTIAAQTRTIGHANGMVRKPVYETGWYTGNKSRFSAPTIFQLGLTDTQMGEAQAEAVLAKRKTPLYRDYTNARGRPLLLLHLLDLQTPAVADTEPITIAKAVPALSVSFPNGAVVKTIDYIVGPVWLRQMRDNPPPNEEEDEDEFTAEPLG